MPFLLLSAILCLHYPLLPLPPLHTYLHFAFARCSLLLSLRPSFDLKVSQIHPHPIPLVVRQSHKCIFIGLQLPNPIREELRTRHPPDIPYECEEPIPVVVQDLRQLQGVPLRPSVSFTESGAHSICLISQ